MARTVLGKGPRPAAVMVIGEAPGETEDRTGLPFCGKAGKELDRGLALADLDRRDVFVTNVCKQRPANNKLPTPAEVAYWRPALIRELAQVRPRVIVAAGGLAAAQFLPPRPLEALHGIPHRVDLVCCGLTDVSDRAEAVATVVPIYHPAAPLHDTTLQTAFSRDWYNVARTLDGALPVWTPDPEPVTVRLVTDATAEDVFAALNGATDVAVDTEGDREHPWGLSFAWTPHEAWVIPATAPRLCQRLSDALQEKTVILHWALHDLAVLRALGLSLGARCEDTLRYARYVAEAGGLKALAYRFARRTLSEYSDVAAPLKARYYRELALWAVEQYPLPPPKPKRSDFPRGILGQLDCWEAQERWQQAEAVAPLRRAWLAVAGSDDPAKAWKTRAGKTLPPVPVWTPPTEGPFLQYAGEDAAATLAVLPTLRKLAAPQAEYATLDNGILPLLDRMQAVGLPVDRRYLEDLSPLLQALRADLRAEMIAMLGMSDDFNPDSGPQVKAALFGLLGLTPTRFSKLTGEPAADEKFLEPLRSQVPFIDCLLQYRELGKLDGTYVQGWLAAIQADGRLRTHLDIGAKTGRLTADKPNVLAIPKHGAWGKLFRNAVRVHVPGRVLASWDMSQIELRVLGEMSQDPDLCRAFREGRDIHSEAASRIWGIPLERLDNDLHRLPSKVLNFGIPMGISGQGLSDQMGKFGIPGWDPDSCERMIDEWKHKAYPRAGAWLLENEAEAMDRGRVVGWGSKVFWLEGIWSTDRRVVEEAKRQASALKIQGGAQVLMKRAMIRLWSDVLPRLQREGYIEPLIQIHDELLFEMDETLIGPADELIVAAMTKTTPLSIPVLADGGYGPIWAGKGWEKFEVQTC